MGEGIAVLGVGSKSRIIVIFVILALSVGLGGWLIAERYPSELAQGKVFVVYAGSLVKTFETELGPAFQRETGYTYIGEGKGAVQLANMIIDRQRSPDVFVSAGTIPIMKLINHIPPLAQWLVKFATAEIVIAYTPNSPFFNDLEKARKGEIPWYEVLSYDDLKFRRTDPELNPKGYYMIIVAKLANLYYNDPSIKDKIIGEDRNSEQLLPEEILMTTLESGQIDAAEAYRHEAVARNLPYIVLPKEINLSDAKFSNFYSQASYALGTGQIVYGEPIYFTVTIPETSNDIEGSTTFIKFLLSGTGRQVLEKDGLNPIKVVVEGDVDKIPSVIKNMVGD